MAYLGNWWPVVLGGVAVVALVSPAMAKTPEAIEALAKTVTVKIEYERAIGTGVIVYRQGQVYSLVTNRHVVCGSGLCTKLPAGRRYRLSLPDGQQIKVNANNIKLLGKDLDLALIQFASSRNYAVTRVAAPGKLKTSEPVFTSGFPEEYREFGFGQGEAIAVVNRRIQGDQGGYSVIYDSPTLPGMSGGGVFNSDGDLVAIHGRGDKYRTNTELGDDSRLGNKIGLNRGIPVRWLIQSLGEMGIVVGERIPLSAIRVAATQVPEVADEYFITGFNRYVEPGADVIAGKKEAIQSFTKAIQLNARYSRAYFMRAYAYAQISEFQNALADYSQAIALNPKYAEAYNNRGSLKHEKLNDPQGALADYNQAIALNPNLADAYYNRGLLQDEQLNNPQGALADFNKAITLNPNLADAYVSRGILKDEQLNDPPGALADFNQAIALNPNLAQAYNNRGILKKKKLNDPQGALADYNQAIALNPNYTDAYYNRGLLKDEQLNDPQGALADYNQAIALKPKFARAHNNRGLLKQNQLNDPQGALADYNQAIALNPKDALAYSNRAALKYQKLNDPHGALADYNQAIALNPNSAKVYGIRGLLKAVELNDRPGGIADLRQAARLARAQGDNRLLEIILNSLKQLGATE
jgi:tetratricopeptide (TPR) repeat protein